MFRNKLTAAVLAAAIGFAPVAASAQGAPVPATVVGTSTSGSAAFVGGCVISIMIAAVDKGKRYKKELTTDEAITCGLAYWLKEATKKR
jgi:hypothetical protein